MLWRKRANGATHRVAAQRRANDATHGVPPAPRDSTYSAPVLEPARSGAPRDSTYSAPVLEPARSAYSAPVLEPASRALRECHSCTLRTCGEPSGTRENASSASTAA